MQPKGRRERWARADGIRAAAEESTALVSKQRWAPNPLFPGENALQAGRGEAERTHLEGPGGCGRKRGLGVGTGPRMRSRPRGGGAGTAPLHAAPAPVPRSIRRGAGKAAGAGSIKPKCFLFQTIKKHHDTRREETLHSLSLRWGPEGFSSQRLGEDRTTVSSTVWGVCAPGSVRAPQDLEPLSWQ